MLKAKQTHRVAMSRLIIVFRLRNFWQQNERHEETKQHDEMKGSFHLLVETDIRRSALKISGHPFAHALSHPLPHFLLPTCFPLPPYTPSCVHPPSSTSFLLHPPSLGKQGQQISLLFSIGPREEDTWTALRVSAWSSHGPFLPLPLSASKEAVIVPAPVSEEIGKSDGFVSCLYDNQEKRAGASYQGSGQKLVAVREKKVGEGEWEGEREGRDLTID